VRRARELAAALLAGLAIAGAGAVALSSAHTSYNMRATLATPNHAVVQGCPVEDTCRIDYRHGRWHIVLRKAYR
jgi:hypothetical protein